MMLVPTLEKLLRLTDRRLIALAVIIAGIFVAPVSASAAALSETATGYEVTVEKDVRIPLPDGSYLMADIFRPKASGNTSTG